MKNLVLFTASIFGMLSIILGAFGAHALKKVLSAEKLTSFEVGARYQMYSALFLLVLGFFLDFETSIEKWVVRCMIFGTILFSGTIYLLCLQDYWTVKLKFLGPLTPLGGLLMIVSWALFIVYLSKKSKGLG